MPLFLKSISATGIRQSIREGREDWKDYVDESIHNFLEAYLV